MGDDRFAACVARGQSLTGDELATLVCGKLESLLNGDRTLGQGSR
jgi:hypothetical protein